MDNDFIRKENIKMNIISKKFLKIIGLFVLAVFLERSATGGNQVSNTMAHIRDDNSAYVSQEWFWTNYGWWLTIIVFTFFVFYKEIRSIYAWLKSQMESQQKLK